MAVSQGDLKYLYQDTSIYIIHMHLESDPVPRMMQQEKNGIVREFLRCKEHEIPSCKKCLSSLPV